MKDTFLTGRLASMADLASVLDEIEMSCVIGFRGKDFGKQSVGCVRSDLG